MPTMTSSPTVRFRLTPEMDTALRDYCEAKGIDMSDLFRDAALRKIGRKDLIGTMRGPGKPKKSE